MTTRDQARAQGLKTFIDPDRPCRKCGELERSTKYGHCMACNRASAKRAASRKRATLEELEVQFATTLFHRLLQLRITANLGRQWVEMEERHARERRRVVP